MGHTDWQWTARDDELQAALGWWRESYYRQYDHGDDGRVLCIGGPADGATCLTSPAFPLALLYADDTNRLGWSMVRVGQSTFAINLDGGSLVQPFLVSYELVGEAIQAGCLTMRKGTERRETPMHALGAYVRTYRDEDRALGEAYTEAWLEARRPREAWENATQFAEDDLDDDDTDDASLTLPDPILVWQPANEPLGIAPVPSLPQVEEFLVSLGRRSPGPERTKPTRGRARYESAA